MTTKYCRPADLSDRLSSIAGVEIESFTSITEHEDKYTATINAWFVDTPPDETSEEQVQKVLNNAPNWDIYDIDTQDIVIELYINKNEPLVSLSRYGLPLE